MAKQPNPIAVNGEMTVIDVRTEFEFMGGNVAGSINIPVHELTHRIEEIRELKGTLVLCCASGSRSALATTLLQSHGIPCMNGGSWLDVNYYVNNNR